MPDIAVIRRRLSELSQLIAKSEDAAEVIKLRRDQDKLLDRLATSASVAPLP